MSVTVILRYSRSESSSQNAFSSRSLAGRISESRRGRGMAPPILTVVRKVISNTQRALLYSLSRTNYTTCRIYGDCRPVRRKPSLRSPTSHPRPASAYATRAICVYLRRTFGLRASAACSMMPSAWFRLRRSSTLNPTYVPSISGMTFGPAAIMAEMLPAPDASSTANSASTARSRCSWTGWTATRSTLC